MATQKGRNWSSGDIVTAANLSSIERGVSAVAEEYTPTTWANGNTVTAAALNNIEQGIANAGGSSWIVLTEESVTTEQSGLSVFGRLAYSEQITADTIKVTFNGTAYTCTKTADGSDNYYGAEWSETEGYDFSTCPFAIESNHETGRLLTETAGTYSIKIEAPQSGGSSDFSTATVRVILQGGTMANICLPFMRRNGSFVCGFTGMDDETVTAVLKDGSAVCMIAGNFDTVTATGSATVTEDYIVTITGDCTITISDSSGGQIAE